MSEQKQYPQWLSGAREAQSRLVEAERLAAEEAERSRQAKREADRQKKTDDMQEVLKAFGIVYPASEMRYEDGRAIIDLPDGYELSCDGLARKPTQYDGLRAKPDSPLRWEFRLTLRKLACEQHETYDWMRRQWAEAWKDFNVIEGKTTDEHLAWLANAVDIVENQIPQIQAQRESDIEHRKEREEQERRWAEQQAQRERQAAKVALTDQINEQLVATARLLKKLDAPLRSQWVVELLDVLRRETRGEDYDFRGTYLGVIQDIAQRMEGELLGYDPDAADESFDDYNNRREREHLESAEYGSDDNSLLDETNPHYDF